MAVLLNRSPLSGQWGLELGQGVPRGRGTVYRSDGGTGMMRTRWKGAALELRMASSSREIGDFLHAPFSYLSRVIIARDKGERERMRFH